MRESALSREVQIPPGLLGVAALTWGIAYDALLYAIVAVALVEGARVASLRFELDDEDFHRLADVSSIALVLLAIVQFSDRGIAGIYGVLKWFPLALGGLLLAQLYSTRSAVKLSALFLSVRFALKRGRVSDPGQLDMRIPFLFACLLSATASPLKGWLLTLLHVALLLWLLLANRPRRRITWSLPLAMAMTALLIAATVSSIVATRRALEPIIMEIVRERIAHWRDPFRSYTALGEVGRIKVSDRIMLRVSAPPGVPVPELLREATYTRFSRNTWLAGDTRFEDVEPSSDGTRWDLASNDGRFRLVTISKSLVRNRGMLSVPAGTFRIDDLPVEELKRSRNAALKVLNGPALVQFKARYAQSARVDAPPTEDDLSVPDYLRDVLDGTLAQIGVSAGGAGTVQRVHSYFMREFSYSLDVTKPIDDLHPVENFLTHSRSGHCEFFATATVLLLRAAGIPARYASGYSVQEWSPLEDAFVVRRRHAHTWVRVWLDGRWLDLDTTPSTWIDAEAGNAAWWQSSYDLLSYLWHAWSRWRLERSTESTSTGWLALALIPLVGILLVRIWRSNRVRSAGSAWQWWRDRRRLEASPETPIEPVERWLDRRGLRRPSALPLGVWLSSLAARGELPSPERLMRRVLPLHHRRRFRPGGLSRAQNQELYSQIEQWLAQAERAERDTPRPRSDP